MFRKSGEVNKNLFIWAAISAFRSRFFYFFAQNKKELRSSRAAKNEKT
jgi:hypothetical protein